MASITAEPATAIDYRSNLDPSTDQVLTAFERRQRLLRCVKGMSLTLIVFAIGVLAVVVADFAVILSLPMRWLLTVTVYATTAITFWLSVASRLMPVPPALLARQIESTEPRLREHLVSAVELADPDLANGSQAFRDNLQRRVGQRIGSLQATSLLPWGLVKYSAISTLVVVATFVLLTAMPGLQFGRRFARAVMPAAPIQRVSLTQLEILSPTPASTYVASGDAVAVIVKMSGRLDERARVDWTTATQSGSLPMSRRERIGSPSAETATHPVDDQEPSQPTSQSIFAVTLPVGSESIDYRVVGGDGATLWHTLTPLPRPRIAEMHRKLVFPKYTQLPDESQHVDHGDIDALVGTNAVMTFTFDQPVESAILRYASTQIEVTLQAVDQSSRSFQAAIPVSLPAQYQVDATSIESGLNNPFAPLFTITPRTDASPSAQWDDSVPNQTIASPLDVLPLAATVRDDLPIDQVIHEYQLPGQRNWQPTAMRLPSSESPVQHTWKWDLLHLNGSKQAETRLQRGDLLRTRLVAVDRKGQKGTSRVVEVLIADDGFQVDRHQKLQSIRLVGDTIRSWLDRCRENVESTITRLSDRRVDAIDHGQLDQMVAVSNSLADEIESLLSSLSELLASERDVRLADELEMMAQTIDQIAADLVRVQGDASRLVEAALAIPSSTAGSERRGLVGELKSIRAQTEELSRFTRAVVSTQLFAGLITDAVSLRSNLTRLKSQIPVLPEARRQTNLALTIAQMRSMDALIAQFDDSVAGTTAQSLDGWRQFSTRWQNQLTEVSKRSREAGPLIQVLSSLEDGLVGQQRYGLQDHRVYQSYPPAFESLASQVNRRGDDVRRLREIGKRWQDAIESDSDGDSGAARSNQAIKEWFAQRYQTIRDQLIHLTTRAEQRHRGRAQPDTRFAADLSLFAQAMQSISGKGFATYQEIPADQSHREVARAMRMLDSAYRLHHQRRSISAVLRAERFEATETQRSLSSPISIDRYGREITVLSKSLRECDLDTGIVNRVDRTRY
ncbi:MAG: hypothetical protein AAGA03_15460, partial [Planctomycetota bacterium]